MTVDLFEVQETLPINLQAILDYYSSEYGEDINYEQLTQMQAECKAIGFSFEWGLDAIPYNLRKIPTRIKKDTEAIKTILLIVLAAMAIMFAGCSSGANIHGTCASNSVKWWHVAGYDKR